MVSEKKSKMSQPIRGQGGHLVFPIGQKKKHNLGRRHWDLASCQVSLNFVQRFQRRSRKMSQPIRGQGGHLVFPISPKNTNLVEDIEILLPVKFRWTPISEKKSKISQPIRGQGGHLVFPIGPNNTNLVEDVEILLPVKFRWIPFSGFREEVENVSANQRPGRPSCFSDRPKKNTNLVEDVEILLPIKFRWIPFSGFREVENDSANQRPGRPSCFSDRPEKHKLGRGRWDLAPYKVSLNSIQRFQSISRKCISQSEARAAILFFRSARKTQTW